MFAKITWMGIAEADVAITDFILFIQCVVLAIMIYRKTKNSTLTWLLATFFLSMGLSTLLGGITHAFLAKDTLANIIFWRMTMLGIVVTSWCICILAIKIGVDDCYG